MDEWSKDVKRIIAQHNKRKNDIENILENLLDANKIDCDCVFKIVDANKLIWDMKIGFKTFLLTSKEILSEQFVEPKNENVVRIIPNGEMYDLEEVIKALILSKIK